MDRTPGFLAGFAARNDTEARTSMEDIRPCLTEDDELENTPENPVEWELALVDVEDEVPFHIPRD